MEEKENLLIDKKILLEKFSGKGGWTYARLPEINLEKKNPFGFKKVKGSIDDVEIKQYHLMPMGNGKLFLPVKAEIRKKIKKEAGDFVHVILFSDDSPVQVPTELELCLKDEPEAWKHFCNLPEPEQKKYINWIFSVKTEELKIERMAKAINKIQKGELL